MNVSKRPTLFCPSDGRDTAARNTRKGASYVMETLPSWLFHAMRASRAAALAVEELIGGDVVDRRRRWSHPDEIHRPTRYPVGGLLRSAAVADEIGLAVWRARHVLAEIHEVQRTEPHPAAVFSGFAEER